MLEAASPPFNSKDLLAAFPLAAAAEVGVEVGGPTSSEHGDGLVSFLVPSAEAVVEGFTGTGSCNFVCDVGLLERST